MVALIVRLCHNTNMLKMKPETKPNISYEEAEKIFWEEIKKGEQSAIDHGWIEVNAEFWKQVGM